MRALRAVIVAALTTLLGSIWLTVKPGNPAAGSSMGIPSDQLEAASDFDPLASAVGIMLVDCTDGQGMTVLAPTATFCVGGLEVMDIQEYSRGTLVVDATGDQLIVTHGHGLFRERHRLYGEAVPGIPDLVVLDGQDGAILIPAATLFGPDGWIDEDRSNDGATYIDVPDDIDLSAIGTPVAIATQPVVEGMTVQIVYRVQDNCYTLDPDCAAVAVAAVSQVGEQVPYGLPAYTLATDAGPIRAGSSGGGVYRGGQLVGTIWGAPLTAAVVQDDSAS
jgi:hypothetical protein